MRFNTPVFWKTLQIAYLFFIQDNDFAYWKTSNMGDSWDDKVVIAKNVKDFSVFADFMIPDDEGGVIHIAYVKGNKAYHSAYEVHLDTKDDTFYGKKTVKTVRGAKNMRVDIVKDSKGKIYIGMACDVPEGSNA